MQLLVIQFEIKMFHIGFILTIIIIIIIEAQQAKICNNYKNNRLKLLKTNAVILFNKICGTS